MGARATLLRRKAALVPAVGPQCFSPVASNTSPLTRVIEPASPWSSLPDTLKSFVDEQGAASAPTAAVDRTYFERGWPP